MAVRGAAERSARLSRHVLPGVTMVLAAALGVVSGVATESLTWLGGWSWGVVAVLVGAAAVIEMRGAAVRDTAALSVPDQIPRDVGDFTGREDDMLELSNLIRAGSGTLLISAIDGTPGVGKSTLQIHAAHRFARRYPDARLYANLRGGEGEPERAQPLSVLDQFLRSLGEQRVPQRLEEATALYRSRLAGKRALILLDNASDEAQVRPLLPGSPTCTVVITSRARLAALEDAHRLTLRVFTEAEAVELLERIVGAERVRLDADATALVVRYCGRLPLALRIAGSRMAHRPEWTMARLAGMLADERVRLAALTAGDLDVRASFMISYTELAEDEKRLFRLASLTRTADLPGGAAVRAAGSAEAGAERHLERLITLHLLEPSGPDGVQFHDLLRLFARQRSLEEDTAAERDAALGRVLGWYLDRLTGAVAGGAAAGSSWLEREQENVLALIDQAASAAEPLRPYCWGLAFALAPYLERRGDLSAWHVSARTASAAAEGAGDAAAQVLALVNTAALHEARGELPRAGDVFAAAVRRARRAGERRPLAEALRGLARVRRRRGELAEAHRAAEEARGIYRTSPDPAGDGEAACLTELSDIATAHGDPHRAAGYCEEALELLGTPGRPGRGGAERAPALARLGAARRELRRFDAARAAFEEAGRRYAAAGDEAGHATMLEEVGVTFDAAGQPRDALAAYAGSRDVHRSLGRTADACRLDVNLALSQWRAGRRDEAVAALERAVGLATRSGDVHVAAGARVNLGEMYLSRGEVSRAKSLFARAREDARGVADPAGQARALMSLARALTRQGDSRGALAALESARGEARRAHDAVVSVTVLVDLGLAHRDRDDLGRALNLLTEAVEAAGHLPAPDPSRTARALVHLAGVEARTARIRAAEAHFVEARGLFREAGERAMEAHTLMYLGRVRREGPATPRFAASESAYREAAGLWHALRDPGGEQRALAAGAVALYHLGDGDTATRRLERAAGMFRGEETPREEAAVVERLLEAARTGRDMPRELPW